MSDVCQQRFFKRVGKWSVPGVVQECGNLSGFDFFFRKIDSFRFQDLERLPHQVHGAQRVVKARVNSARVNELCKPQLAYVTHALEKGVFNQIKNLFAFDRYKPVHGIVYDFVFVQDERGIFGYR